MFDPLQPGEIVFAVMTHDGQIYQYGEVANSADDLEHALLGTRLYDAIKAAMERRLKEEE